jgi:hypothetical protein
VIRVCTVEGRVQGKVISVDPETMTLAVSGRSVVLPRSRVIRVAEVGGRVIGRDMGRDLLIGAAIGSICWAIVSKNCGVSAAAGGVYGALDGAIIGGLVGIGDRRERVVYRADPHPE